MPLFGPPNVDKMKARKDFKGLIKALGYEKDAVVRAEAAMALVEMREAAVEPLIGALKEEDPDVYQAAIGALVRIGKPAVEPLIAALKQHNLRKGALQAIHVFGRPTLTLAVGRLWADVTGENDNVRGEAIEALTAIGEPAVEMLLSGLADQRLNERKVAVTMVLMMTATSDAIPHHSELVTRLNQTLQDKGMNARGAIASALGEIRDPRALEPLSASLVEDELLLRWSAAGALFALGNAQAMASLEDLQEEDLLIQGISLVKLIADGHTVKSLIAGLADDDQAVRQASRQQLIKLGWKPA